MTETDAGEFRGHPTSDFGRSGGYLLMSSDPPRNVDPSEGTGSGVDPSEGPGNVDPSEGTTGRSRGGVDPSEGPATQANVDPSEGLVGPDPWDD